MAKYIVIRPHRRMDPPRRIEAGAFAHAVVRMTETTGMAAAAVRNILRWRLAAGLGVQFDRVLEGDGSVTVLR